MSGVIVTFKVLPQDISIDINFLEKRIAEEIKPQSISKEPIAFGLVAIKFTKLIPESSGELEKMEKRIKSIEGVGEVEITEISRSL